MKILLMVNESPWGSTLSMAALRFARAAVDSGHEVPAVYFRGDGVYNLLRGCNTDDGLVALADDWSLLGDEHGIRLLCCSAAASRRQNVQLQGEEAGLAQWWELVSQCDQVVTF